LFTKKKDKMPIKLTEKQARVLDAIRSHQNEYGFPPTVRELAEKFGHSSTAGIHKMLKILQSKGHLVQSGRGKSRAVGLVAELPESRNVKSLPIVGRVIAGEPELAVEDKEGDLLIDAGWVSGRNTFLLRVTGHSMIDADIRPGDLVVVEPATQVRNGDVVIALLEEEATVKRFFKEKDKIRLQPDNQSMQPIYIDRNDPSFRVIGIVKGLLRRF
jgi:repressor LexA